MSNRVDELLAALSNGETAGITPQSRVEAILKALIGGSGIEGLPIPQSVTEAYLYSMAKNGIGGGGGGGNPAGPSGPIFWNDITDKPFGTEPFIDIQWDGDMTDKTMIDMSIVGWQDAYYVKVSDTVYTVDDLIGTECTYIDTWYEETYTDKYMLPEDWIWDDFNLGFVNAEDFISVYDADAFCESLGVPLGTYTTGTYVIRVANYDDEGNIVGYYRISELVKEKVVKIDEKFLPEKIVGENLLFDIQWDGNMEGHDSVDMTPYGVEGEYLVKVSDLLPNSDQVVGAMLFGSGEDPVDITEDRIDYDSIPGVTSICNAAIYIVYTAEDASAALGLPEGTISNGIWFVFAPEEHYYVKRFANSEIIKLDPKYLPDDIGGGVSSYNDLTDKPDLKPVATSGSYNDLTDKPVGITYRDDEIYNGQHLPYLGNIQSATVQLNKPLVNNQRYKIKMSYPINGLMFESIIQAFVVDIPAMNLFNVTITRLQGSPIDITNITKDGGMKLSLNTVVPNLDYNWTVTIYELIESPLTLDEKFLPESVITTDKLDEALTDKPSTSEVQNMIDTALGVIENGTY